LADHEVTERLLTAGKVLGIDLLDHLVIAEDQYLSILPNQTY
jgi:DNA repair protein RadC